MFRRLGAGAESTQTESDCEVTTSPEELNIKDDLKGASIVKPSIVVEEKLFRMDKTFVGAGAESVGIKNKVKIEATVTDCIKKDSLKVDTGYLTEEENYAES